MPGRLDSACFLGQCNCVIGTGAARRWFKVVWHGETRAEGKLSAGGSVAVGLRRCASDGGAAVRRQGKARQGIVFLSGAKRARK
ncbi:hypothetical protein M3J09_002871 [Ascochyta lentis]